MFKPEEQQVEICLLKSNLEEIENDLVVHRSTLPALDAENEAKYRETMTALQVTRSLNTDIERLKLENVKLSAKRHQQKRYFDEIAKSIESARATRTELGELLEQEQRDTELLIHQYEDTMEELADRFRKTRGYYNEDEMTMEIEKINTTITELEAELEQRRSVVNEMKLQLNDLQPNVPEDLLAIFGKTDLDSKVKELTDEERFATEKLNLLATKKSFAQPMLKNN